MTFSDIARLAKTILLEQHDIRQGEKESFNAIMIDEFQDNNELQKDLLYLLAENTTIITNSAMPTAMPTAQNLCPGKLFFVGDEKQSIYRFRGADVSVFRKLRQELGSGELPLKTNYRSSPLLIGAFNAIFGGHEFDPEGNDPLGETTEADDTRYPAVFAPDSPELPPYEASFRPLVAHRTAPAAAKDMGKLTLCILNKQDSDEVTDGEADRLSPVENEARYVAERIRALIDGQQYRPDDIAILFRSRVPQRLFEKHLMLLGVPYASEDLNGFFYGSPVNDIMSVLRLAAYPMDRAAYAQMLRSPFAGLSLPGLAICLAVIGDQEKKSGEAQPSPQPFGDEPLPLLTEADRARYLQGQKVYRSILGRARTDSVSALVSELWYGEGYRYETEWNPRTAPYRELHDYLFHLAAKADDENQGLATFTDFILSMDRPGQRLSDIEIPMERPGAVRLMTIHKSKGLEFPVVFLCCCDKKGRNDFSDDIFDTGESGLTLNPPLPPEFERAKDVRRNYFWERSLAAEKGKRTAELRRLLYVGMTRAENELYLSGCLGISKFLGIDDAPDSDFPLHLKQYAEQKAEKAAGNSGINGDSILEGSTFFGLCLNALATHIPEAGFGLPPPFFSIEKIPLYDEHYLRNAEQVGSRFANDQRGLDSFFEIAGPRYKDAAVIETPVVPNRHLAPTALKPMALKPLALSPKIGGMPAPDFSVSGEYSGDDAADVFGRIEPIIGRYAKQFDYGSFGTLAHLCVEALLSGKEAAIPPQMANHLSPTDAEALLEAGKELALRFARSPLGVIAGKTENRHSEFRFRSLIQSAQNGVFFINGTIDLVFEDAEAVHVVDFKTDSGESPGEHVVQMACYYRAVSDLFAAPAKKEIRAWLYYLRSGHAVEVTVPAGEFDPKSLEF
jgi:ATP-dependent helicase/nuclease subunit A